MFLAETRRKRSRSSQSASSFIDSNGATTTSSSSSSSLRRRLSNDWKIIPDGSSSSKSGRALEGVIICVTGLSPDSKSRCHELVEELGGSFTRHLDSSQNTHLIAQSPDGPKYEAAVSCPNMFVVKPSWVEACHATKRRVEEKEHFVVEPSYEQRERNRAVTYPISLAMALIQSLQVWILDDQVFSQCVFTLVGFDDDKSEERFLIERLIRRGWGTIFYELNDFVSHLIVADGCDEPLCNAIRIASLRHPSQIVAVSPWWLVSSWQEKRLATPEVYPPRPASVEVPKEQPLKAKLKPQKKKKSCFYKSSALFRGCLFALLRMAPPENAVDFDEKQLEEMIRSNGGQLLSLKLVEALRVDAKGQPQEFEQRVCYAVCWGGGHTPTQISLHPLLSQVQRFQLANIAEVTPIWLKTSVVDQRRHPPHSFPLLFRAQSWLFRRLIIITDDDNKTENATDNKTAAKKIKVSITGFQSPERTAIIQIIEAIGATYDDTMRTTTTHLLCKDDNTTPVGPKFQKAIKWGLHVLSIEWLYHVARYGYKGQDNCDDGCEDRFSVANRVLTDNSTVQNCGTNASQEIPGSQELEN